MLNFIIENNGGLVDDKLRSVSVTGTFTFDTVKLAISNLNVLFTGYSGVSGTYTGSPHLDLSNPHVPLITFERHDPDAEWPVSVGLRLSGLGDASPYEIIGGYWDGPADPFGDEYFGLHSLYVSDNQNRPTIARVVSEPAVPEPSTWAMVLGAFASAAAWMRRRKMQLRG